MTKKEMKKLEVVFIIDRSGSMAGLEADTIGGFNSTLEKQKKENAEVIWSTVLFDDRHEVIHDRVPIENVKSLTEEDYYVRGCTALLDAIGRSIHHIGVIHKYARKEDRPDRTLFVITTDGMENASRQYTYRKVSNMVSRQKERYGWEFIFLGANMDAVKVASRMGITADRSATYMNDATGIKKNYEALAGAMYDFSVKGEIRETFLDEVRKDFARRSKKK